MYIFIACDTKLPTFQEALQDEQIRSYNELLAMGLTDEQIRLRGHDFSKIDRDKKIFLIMLPEELEQSPLEVEPDFHNAYARYLTDKRFIYKVVNAEKVLAHFVGYIGKYAETWRELELWSVDEDDYSVDSTQIPQRTIHVQKNMSSQPFENLFEEARPQMLRFLLK